LPREIDVRTAHGASLLRDYLESKKDDAPFARELRELLDHAGTIDDLERTLVTRREQIKAFRERSNEVRDELGHLDKVEASPLRKTLEQRLSDLDADPSKLTSEIVGLHEGLLATRTRFQDVLLCMTLVPELPHP
jgi:predicted  nucleic acid-binding Zn-ribbon protein